MSVKTPYLPQFSGQNETGDVSYEVWKHEVICLLREGLYSESAILQGIRKSLKGKARSVLAHLGHGISPWDVLSEFSCLYGLVSSAEKVKERFYSETQQEKETIADYSIRLEELVSHLQLDRHSKNEMLCSRLWSGLRDKDFRNFSRFKYESISDFATLRKVLREMEDDFVRGHLASSTSSAPSVQPVDIARQNSIMIDQLKGITDQMAKFNTRLDRLENEIKCMKTNNYRQQQQQQTKQQHTSQQSQNNQRQMHRHNQQSYLQQQQPARINQGQQHNQQLYFQRHQNTQPQSAPLNSNPPSSQGQ